MENAFSSRALHLLSDNLRARLNDKVSFVPREVPRNLQGLTGKVIMNLMDQAFAYGLPHLVQGVEVWVIRIGTPDALIRVTAGFNNDIPMLLVGPIDNDCQLVQLLNGAVVWNPQYSLETVATAHVRTDRIMDHLGFLDEDGQRRIGLLEGMRPIPNEVVFRGPDDHFIFANADDALHVMAAFDEPLNLICVDVPSGFVLCDNRYAHLVAEEYGMPTNIGLRRKTEEWARRVIANQNDFRRLS